MTISQEIRQVLDNAGFLVGRIFDQDKDFHRHIIMMHRPDDVMSAACIMLRAGYIVHVPNNINEMSFVVYSGEGIP